MPGNDLIGVVDANAPVKKHYLVLQESSISERQAEPQQPEEDHKIDEQVAEALACPCVDDLRSGPCGKSFEAAFSCFLRHQAKHKVRTLAAAHMLQEMTIQLLFAALPLAVLGPAGVTIDILYAGIIALYLADSINIPCKCHHACITVFLNGTAPGGCCLTSKYQLGSVGFCTLQGVPGLWAARIQRQLVKAPCQHSQAAALLSTFSG